MTTTRDKFLGGRLTISQPAEGFRAGLDAVMLAAAVPARVEDNVLELGAGVGTASLCLASRASGCSVTGVEIDPALVALAKGNASENGLDARVRFETADVLALTPALATDYAHVFFNPPFHDEDEQPSPNAQRARATHDAGALGQWLKVGLKRTRPRGTLTLILRTDRMNEALNAAPAKGVVLFPLCPRKGEAAKRVLLQIRKGSEAAIALLPGLVLHEASGRYTPEADAVLKGDTALPIGVA